MRRRKVEGLSNEWCTFRMSHLFYYLKILKISLYIFLLLSTKFSYAHICDDVFRQLDKLIIKPESDVIKIKDKGEFRIFVQNNMNRAIARMRIEGKSKEFDLKIEPKEYKPLPRHEPKYFTVKLRLKEGVKPGKYPITFSVIFDQREVKKLDLSINGRIVEGICAPKTDKAPKIDGVLDDSCWQHAEKITNFVINEEGELAKHQTIVFLTHDNKNLYLGFGCAEPNIDKLVENVKSFDAKVYKDDAVGIFLGETDTPNIYHYIFVNPKSIIRDSKVIEKKERKWNSKAIARTSKGDDAWFVEIALPLTEFKTGKDITSLYMNFMRIKKAGKKEEVSFWRYMRGYVPIYLPEKLSEVILSP